VRVVVYTFSSWAVPVSVQGEAPQAAIL